MVFIHQPSRSFPSPGRISFLEHRFRVKNHLLLEFSFWFVPPRPVEGGAEQRFPLWNVFPVPLHSPVVKDLEQYNRVSQWSLPLLADRPSLSFGRYHIYLEDLVTSLQGYPFPIFLIRFCVFVPSKCNCHTLRDRSFKNRLLRKLFFFFFGH